MNFPNTKRSLKTLLLISSISLSCIFNAAPARSDCILDCALAIDPLLRHLGAIESMMGQFASNKGGNLISKIGSACINQTLLNGLINGFTTDSNYMCNGQPPCCTHDSREALSIAGSIANTLCQAENLNSYTVELLRDINTINCALDN